jgi:phage baseplate assembly protein gpV
MPDSSQGIRNIYNRIDQAKAETNFIAEALVTQVRKKDKRVELVLLPDFEEIGWVRLYMLNANGNYSSGQLPEVDTTVLVLFPNGNSRNAICLSGGFCEADELGYEPTGDYDLVLTDKYGNKILMEDGGITIEDKSGNKIITTSSKITIEGASAIEIKSSAGSSIDINGSSNVNIDAAVQVKLGSGSAPVARVGDQVATPMGPGTILGTIPGIPNTKVFV